MGYDETDFIPCEVCGGQAIDIHHIEARGMGGTKKKTLLRTLWRCVEIVTIFMVIRKT